MDNCEVRKLLASPTMTVPEAGRIMNLSRSSAYTAAKRGEIKTVKVGGRLIVPTNWLRQVLMIED